MKLIQNITLKQQLLIFALSLVLIRIFKYENIGALFLVWNLFLAVVPLALIKLVHVFETKYWKISILFLSILFLPNSIYIFTDLFHLKNNMHGALWYDLLLILTYALLGFIYFSETLLLILDTLKTTFKQEESLKTIKIVLILLCSFGVYLGRYLRLNSWDIFTDPVYVFTKISQAVELGKTSEILQVTLFFGLFIYFINEFFEKAKQ